jgi:hypothetical protein
MNKDEALRIALEALGWTDEWRPQGLKEEAITAIKAALEAKDEPKDGGWTPERIAGMARLKAQQDSRLEPQRTFVGLTDEEIEQGCKESWITEQAFQSAVWWAEAKLKEKNT